MRILPFIVVLGAILFAGCENKKIDKDAFSTQSNISQEELHKAQNLDRASYAGLEHVFSETSEINPEGKFLMLVFGKNNCQWCDRLKDDLKADQQTQAILKDHFKSYYINLSYNKIHHISFPNQQGDLQTPALAEQYQIRPTPTLVFLDPQGQPIVIYPGYLPQNQLRIFLDFIASGEYKNAKTPAELHQMLQAKLQGE